VSRTFVIGDIHGAYRALRQCVEKSGIKDDDHLICLGDVCDGWPETKPCVDYLLQLKKVTYILGNHDLWLYEWMLTGKPESIWLTQGGDATMKSYADGVPLTHVSFFQKALPYFIENNKLFVHAGIDPEQPVEKQGLDTLLWDRSLVQRAVELYNLSIDRRLTVFDEVFVGHTPILSKQPIKACGIWMMDTGAGWSGVLSMMDVETKDTFISDPVTALYPGVEGRKPKGV
jgi:serine/threonine protein phosphatase 1